MKKVVEIFTFCFVFLGGSPTGSLYLEQVFAETAALVFIVNADNPATEVSATEVRDFYFKRKRQWSNGENVRFIDRNTGNPLRDNFLKSILQKSNSDVELFWIGQKLYTGDSAPLREASDNSTLQFVASFKGALGYVSATTVLPEKVKQIKINGGKED